MVELGSKAVDMVALVDACRQLVDIVVLVDVVDMVELGSKAVAW